MTCGRCHRRIAGVAAFSKFTRNHYCVDVDACTKRVQKNDRAAAQNLGGSRAAAQTGETVHG